MLERPQFFTSCKYLNVVLYKHVLSMYLYNIIYSYIINIQCINTWIYMIYIIFPSCFFSSMNEVVHTSPTIGSNVEEIVVNNTHFLMWDIGGQESLRSSWNTYYTNTEVILGHIGWWLIRILSYYLLHPTRVWASADLNEKWSDGWMNGF